MYDPNLPSRTLMWQFWIVHPNWKRNENVVSQSDFSLLRPFDSQNQQTLPDLHYQLIEITSWLDTCHHLSFPAYWSGKEYCFDTVRSWSSSSLTTPAPDCSGIHPLTFYRRCQLWTSYNLGCTIIIKSEIQYYHPMFHKANYHSLFHRTWWRITGFSWYELSIDVIIFTGTTVHRVVKCDLCFPIWYGMRFLYFNIIITNLQIT